MQPWLAAARWAYESSIAYEWNLFQDVQTNQDRLLLNTTPLCSHIWTQKNTDHIEFIYCTFFTIWSKMLQKISSNHTFFHTQHDRDNLHFTSLARKYHCFEMLCLVGNIAKFWISLSPCNLWILVDICVL